MQINRADNANSPEGLQAPQMSVAGNDQISLAGHRTFQNPVVGWIVFNDVQSDSGADDLGYSG